MRPYHGVIHFYILLYILFKFFFLIWGYTDQRKWCFKKQGRVYIPCESPGLANQTGRKLGVFDGKLKVKTALFYHYFGKYLRKCSSSV